MLKSIIADWENNREEYLRLCKYIELELCKAIAAEGFIVKIVYRVKDPVNLAQKLIKERLEYKNKGIVKSFDELYVNIS